MLELLFCRDAQTLLSHVRSWVENSLVRRENLTPTMTGIVYVRKWDGSDLYLVNGSTLKYRDFLRLIVLARSIKRLPNYRLIWEYLFLQRLMFIIPAVQITRCRKFFTKAAVLILFR